MTDNRTTELRISEPLRGFIRHQSNRAYIDGGQARWLTKIADEIDAKHEQAIAATLGNERATHGTLTAELVERIVDRNCEWYEGGEIDAQAIVDELNVVLGSGTCKITATATNNLMYQDYMTKWYELSCGHSMTLKGDEAPKWCAVCGKVVER